MPENNIEDARLLFNVQATIANVERKLKIHGDLNRYDVYCEWYEDEEQNDTVGIEVWLRDRRDDSRVGPLDPNAFLDA
jgi:hypothetical protein